MATKTISIDLEAYERLRLARREPNESFSRVIKRAIWVSPPSTAASLLAALGAAPVVSRETLDDLERAQRDDQPPESEWTDLPSTPPS